MATRYFNAGNNTEATPYGSPMGGGDITPLGGGEGSGLFKSFDFSAQEDLANQRKYAQLEKLMGMEQAKREADAKRLNDAYAKFQLDVTGARNAQEIKQRLQGEATEGYNQALRDPLFASAVAKMEGARREPMTQQERDSYLMHTQGIRERQAQAALLAQHKDYVSDYDKQRLAAGGENVHTPLFEQTLQGQLPDMQALKGNMQMYYGRSKDISEHLRKDVSPIIKDFMDQSDEIIGLRRDLSALKPGENAWFHQAKKVKSATIEKALQTLSGIWDSDIGLDPNKNKGLTKEQYLENAKAFVSQVVDKTLSAEPYKLAEEKAKLDLNNDIAKLRASKAMETIWEEVGLDYQDTKGNTHKISGFQGNLPKEYKGKVTTNIPYSANEVTLDKYTRDMLAKLQQEKKTIPYAYQSLRKLHKFGNQIISDEQFDKLSEEQKKQAGLHHYVQAVAPDVEVFKKLIEENMKKLNGGKDPAGAIDFEAAYTDLVYDDNSGNWGVKKGSSFVEKGGTATIPSRQVLVPIDKDTEPNLRDKTPMFPTEGGQKPAPEQRKIKIAGQEITVPNDGGTMDSFIK